jgi:hypothetical protein
MVVVFTAVSFELGGGLPDGEGAAGAVGDDDGAALAVAEGDGGAVGVADCDGTRTDDGEQAPSSSRTGTAMVGARISSLLDLAGRCDGRRSDPTGYTRIVREGSLTIVVPGRAASATGRDVRVADPAA